MDEATTPSLTLRTSALADPRAMASTYLMLSRAATKDASDRKEQVAFATEFSASSL